MLLLCVALPLCPRLSFLFLHFFHHATWVAPLLGVMDVMLAQ